MKKILILLIFLVTLTGCNSKKQVETDALKFKEEYELLNGTTNTSGKEYRTISIADNNPFVYSSAEEIVKKINQNDTFYVYFGSKLCSWCRSVIEMSITVAKQHHIETIYYVDIWDDEGKEILRDKYILEDEVATISSRGTEAYYQLLDLLNDFLSDYTLTDEDGNVIDVGEKRIYAPSFIYIEDGKVVRLTEGTSSQQTDSHAILTDNILSDEEELFNKFFE